jgi:ATP-dependent Clp protease ATP-binding subunit ClpX
MATDTICSLRVPIEEMQRRYENRGITSQTREIISEEKIYPAKKEINWFNPKTIVDYLDDFVAGQDEAKKTIAYVFCRYMLKLENPNSNLTSKNLLITGPSGCGKTYMMKTLCKKAEIPFITVQMTGKTPASYRGKNFATTFEEFFAQQRNSPYGIMFLDEIDKIAIRENSQGEGLQDELIGYMEGGTIDKVRYDLGKDISEKRNTKNILFIGAGAFQRSGESSSLEEIVKARVSSGNSIEAITPEDFIEYGFKPELIGRFNTFTKLNPLSEEDLVNILSNKKECILSEHIQELKLMGYDLTVEKDAIYKIVKNCPREIGARGLSGICSKIFQEIIFQPEKYLVEEKKMILTSKKVEEVMEK